MKFLAYINKPNRKYGETIEITANSFAEAGKYLDELISQSIKPTTLMISPEHSDLNKKRNNLSKFVDNLVNYTSVANVKRIITCLVRENIDSVEEIIQYDNKFGIENIMGLGEKSVNVIRTCIKECY